MAAALRELVQSGQLDLPLPGSGATGERFSRLAAVGRRDPVLGRLAEAHTDAVAILAELGGPVVSREQVWGVWAAEPPRPVLTAERTGSGWRLRGRKAWCSGAHSSTHALVTARVGTDRPLFAVDLSKPGVRPVAGTWAAVGMAASDSGAVEFEDVPAEPVGAVDAYLSRPGFWHGAIGVAAAWYGGACGVADALAARRDKADEHQLAHLGAVTALLAGARWSLQAAATEIDDDPTAGTRATALSVRAIVEDAATATLYRVGRALGAGPLCSDAVHAARVADLTVYLRQSHAEHDLVALAQDGGAGW
ncbi:MAG: acyl-CoA dehydrogenase family protein [Mycobacteriaceae bacterium]